MLSVSTLFLQTTGELSIELDSNESVRVRSVAGILAVDTAIGSGLYSPYLAVGSVASASVRHITILGGDEANTIDLSGVFAADFTSLTTIIANGLNGHDTLLGSVDLPSSLIGGDGNDFVRGGSAIDTLLGNNGDDTIIGGAGDDLLSAGDGADLVRDSDAVTAGGGNDLISLGDGNDTANGEGGNDTIDGSDGFDSIIGGLGDDSLNGGMGNDTIVGNFGNDSIIGASGADILYGDSDDPAIIATGLEGNDTIDAGAGNDFVDGGGGADNIDGGSGDDKLESTTFTTTTNDSLPIPVTNVNAGNPVPLADARPTGLATSNVGTTATMTTGNGDGGLIVTVDGTGKFGAFSEVVQPNPINNQIFVPQTLGNPPIAEFKGWKQEGAVYNPLGDGLGFVPDQTTIESGVYFRFGTATGIPRQLLNEAANNIQTPINILGTTTEAVSSFTIGALRFDLTQQVQPQFDLTSNKRVGTLLTQTYVITNTNPAATPAVDFELVRYLDGDLNFDGRDGLGGTTSNSTGGTQNGVPDGASNDGGGHLVNKITGDEFLFETEQGGVSSNGTFIGITSKPNPALPPAPFPANRFELSLFPSLRNAIRNGDALKNQVTNDANSDGSVDPGQEGNVTLAFRNTYSLLPGASSIYTTHTVFGNGRPDVIQFNRGPATVRDGNDPNDPTDNNIPPIVSLASEPVTIDVVKNDVDVDGTIDYSSVQIDTPPSKGAVEVIGDGRIRYTPDPTSSGTFSFTYTVADNLGSRSIPTLVFIVVNPDSAGDAINGGGGNDTLVGADGLDSLIGGSGEDSIFGGTNRDNLSGQTGQDSIIGGGGSDTLNGGGGNDVLSSLPTIVPSLFINDVTVLEGLETPVSNGNVTATFVITLDRPIEQPVTFQYTILSGTATAGGINAAGTDVVAATGLLTIEPCETTITLPVQILGDVLAELTETYTVVLTNLQNAQVGKAIGVGQILNNGLMLDTTGGPSLVNATRQFGDQNTVQIAINPIDTTKAVMVTNDRPASFLNALFGGNLVPSPELGVFISNDGGRSWNPSPTIFNRLFDGVATAPITPESRYHGSVAYDRQGNLHIAYVAETPLPGPPVLDTLATGPAAIVYAISRDNGLTFQPQLLTGRAVGNDRPYVAVGPDAVNPALDAVYVTYKTGVNATSTIEMQGAQVPPALPNLPAIQTPVPQFAAAAPATVTNVNAPNFPIATVGPAGEVAVTWQTPVLQGNNQSFQGPSTVNYAFDNNGRLGGLTFPAITTITSSNVGSQDLIPALNPLAINVPTTSNFLVPSPPDEQAYASPIIAYDRSGGPHDGRLYLAYVDEQANESDNLDIFLRYSDNDGTTFSDPIRVNDDIGFNSQFHPSLAVDQSNGVVVVGWYDARNDFFGGQADTDIGGGAGLIGSLTGVNTDVEYFVTASYDGGTTFLPNVLVSGGSTSAIRNRNFSFTGGLLGNYTGITAANGVILATWADNSNSTGDNPDGTFGLDAYVARLTEASTGAAFASAFTSQTDPGDLILGGDGDDTLNGGDSGDTLNGQDGNDLLFGGCNNDLLLGGTGMDTLNGGFGEDTLDGQGGADLLLGNQDNDTFLWGSSSGGNDTVVGDSGLDTTSVTGTNGSDSFIIGQSGKNLTVSVANKGTLTVTHPGAAMAVVVNALGGDDLITVGTIDTVVPLVLTADGGDGNDVVTAKNALVGGNRLALVGSNGNDTLVGSKGSDTLRGGAGNDNLRGDDGNDLMLGGLGIDVINGQGGNDTLFGDEVADTISGANSGSGDSMLGGDGNDVMSGGGGNDTMNGDDGNDSIRGNDGADIISGGMGNDALFGDINTDVLSGGAGNDTLDGGRNDDTLNGNAGNDRILGDHGNDSITGADGDNTVLGGDGNDTIRTGSGNDAIFGGDGDDLINSDGGNDTVIGGDGADTMLGGAGNDLLLGRDGADYIDGQAGIDTIAGNEGADTLIAEPGEIDELFALTSIDRRLLALLGLKP
jgi:Ca2+-binding RTX toxin-like protein